MPSRENCLIWIEELDPPCVSLTWAHYSWQNSTRIKRRVNRLARKYSRGWECAGCGEVMPPYKRIDAKYCSETCRKRAARNRRASSAFQ